MKSKASNTKQQKLFFSNISLNAEEINIFDLFSQYGKINDIEILKDKIGRSRGSGYIEFEDPSSNQKAIEALDGKFYKDSLLHLEIAQANFLTDNNEEQKRELLSRIEKEHDQTKVESQRKLPYFTNSHLEDLPALPPPPPIYPMDQILPPSRPLSLPTPPFIPKSEFPNQDQSNDNQKNHGNDGKYSGSEYDYDYYNSDYYNSDYYYSESDEGRPKQNQNIPQLSKIIPPLNSFQIKPQLSDYDSKYSNLPLTLNPPPPIPPLPPIIPALGSSTTLVPNSSSALINQYNQSSRNPTLSLLNAASISERTVPQQNGLIPPGYDMQRDKDYDFGIRATASTPSSSIIQSHEHHHHHRTSRGKIGHRVHGGDYEQRIIDSPIHREANEQWMVMPPTKDSLYWRKKRAKVIEELKKTAYEELKKSSYVNESEKSIDTLVTLMNDD